MEADCEAFEQASQKKKAWKRLTVQAKSEKDNLVVYIRRTVNSLMYDILIKTCLKSIAFCGSYVNQQTCVMTKQNLQREIC